MYKTRWVVVPRYQIKELKHIDISEALLCLDLLGAADVLVFGVSAVV